MNMQSLLSVPENQRDLQWEYQFLDSIPNTKYRVLFEEPQQGPDGWPYLLVENSDEGTDYGVALLDWLATRGIGMVINPQKDYPDFVLSWGMAWFFREKKRFFQPTLAVVGGTEVKTAAPTSGTFTIEQGKNLILGQPTEDYMPVYVRNIISQFFLDQAVLDPKILMVSEDGQSYDLTFSIESLGNPPQSEHQGILEAVSWFLPPHYSVAMMSEAALSGFQSLRISN